MIDNSSNRELTRHVQHETVGTADPGLLGKETDGCRHGPRSGGGGGGGGRRDQWTWAGSSREHVRGFPRPTELPSAPVARPLPSVTASCCKAWPAAQDELLRGVLGLTSPRPLTSTDAYAIRSTDEIYQNTQKGDTPRSGWERDIL